MQLVRNENYKVSVPRIAICAAYIIYKVNSNMSINVLTIYTD